MTGKPLIGHWYAGPANRPNPRRVVSVEPIGDGYRVLYETVNGKQKSCWCSTWEEWAVTDLGLRPQGTDHA